VHTTLSDLKCNQSEVVVASLRDIHFIMSLNMEALPHTKPDLPRHPMTVLVLRNTIKRTLVVMRKCNLTVVVRLFIYIVGTMTCV
jgi:hypothetical protein